MDNIEKSNDMLENEPYVKPAQGKWELKDRLRSKVLWAAVIGGVIQIITLLGLWDKIGITSEIFKGIAVAVGAILEAFGVFNNPTDRNAF